METIRFTYDKVYNIHGDGYSADGREINFDGDNLKSLMKLIAMRSAGEHDVCIETDYMELLKKDGEFLERRQPTLTDGFNERITAMLNMAARDYLAEGSCIEELETHFVTKWIEKKGDQLVSQYILLFAMSLVQYIIEDAGAGKGLVSLYNDEDAVRICAKIYNEWDDRFLDYSNYLNYFTFSIPYNTWKESFENWKATGDYMLPETMESLDPAFILERIVPAFYFSLLGRKTATGRVKDLYSYSFEMA